MKPIDLTHPINLPQPCSIKEKKTTAGRWTAAVPSVDTCARIHIYMCGRGLFIVVGRDYILRLEKKIEKLSVHQPTGSIA